VTPASPVRSLLVGALVCFGTLAPAQSLPQPSEEACIAWAKQFEQSIALGERDFLKASFDVSTFMQRTLGQTPTTPAMRKGMAAAFEGQGGALADIVLQWTKAGGTYTFLGLRSQGGARVALFRLAGSRGLNYHEWRLLARPGNQVGACDLLIALTGDWYSSTLHRIMASAMPQLRGQGKAEAALDLGRISQSFQAHQRAGEHEKARADLDQFPAAMRRESWWFIARLSTLDSTKEPALYKETFEAFAKAQPQDKGLRMTSLDYHFVLKDWDGCLKDLDDLNRLVGGDPYLEILAANVMRTKGSPEGALARAEAALRGDARLKQAHDLRLDLALELERFEVVASELTTLEREFNVKLTDLTKVPRFKAFVASKTYADWNQQRQTAAQAD
jgi:hypothetical protein